MAHKKKGTRSALVYCQENFSCRNEKSEAVIVCVECDSSQCESCDTSLHGSERNRYHERKRIEKPIEDELCQQGHCSEKNYSDVWCDRCNSGFCYTCDNVKHKPKKRSHERVSFQSYKDKLEKFKQHDLIDGFSNVNLIENQDSSRSTTNSPGPSDFVSCAFEDTNFVPIKQPCHFSESKTSLPDIVDNHSLDGFSATHDANKNVQSFLLVDTKEYLQVSSANDFIQNLGCEEDCLVKVISIFGNTGDGKSHTLNHTFFGGREVFKTSNDQDTCTIGVWAAFDHVHKVIVLDTEGLLGTSSNANQRTRLLLKILAVSDIVIYRTRAERLHDDLFHFLGDASTAYTKHFSKELRSCLKKCNLKNISSLGPSVILFHETLYTDPLDKGTKALGSRATQHAQERLKHMFGELEIDISAFSGVDYIGVRTDSPPTDFQCLLQALKAKLDNVNVRSYRRPDVVFHALQALNEKFSGEIEHFTPTSFPDQYFTCTAKCLSCGLRCENTMNHEQDKVCHEVKKTCRYQHQHENKLYLCKKCLHNGERVQVVPKAFSSKDNSWLGMAAYAWAGYVLECPYCGVIYRSRQYWYGNEDPDRSTVQTEICHVWPGGNSVVQGTHNAARKLVDGLTYMSDTIASVSSKPAKVVGNWVTDQIAPAYWVPNALIQKCRQCSLPFSEQVPIHHCRACGEGFCHECSSHNKPVPERGWGEEPVRVCDNCYHGTTNLSDSSNSEGPADDRQVTLRKGAEVVGSTVATLMSYPLDALKESSRPLYWVPDQEITHCCVCKEAFGPTLKIHHCRDCGKGVCSGCSPRQIPVPARGWDTPVRVCNACLRKARPK